MTKIACEICADMGWVCENHPDRPWLEPPAGCLCGAGAPCPRCNTFPDGSAPDVSRVIETVDVVDEDLAKRKIQ